MAAILPKTLLEEDVLVILEEKSSKDLQRRTTGPKEGPGDLKKGKKGQAKGPVFVDADRGKGRSDIYRHFHFRFL